MKRDVYRPQSFGASRSILALMLREMSTTYGRSPGGYIWVVLEQIGILAVFTLAFSLFLKTPSLGTSFILFYATGYLPFRMYQDIAIKLSQCIRFSKPLLVYPTISFVDAVLARLILAVITQLMVSYIILTAVLSFEDTRVILDFGAMASAMIMAAGLGVGVGTLNAVLFGYFPIWKTAFMVATRPLLIASGVIFIYEDLPSQVQAFMWYNPLLHVLGVMRTGFYPFYEAQYVSYVYVTLLSLGLTLLGLFLLRRHFRRLVLI